MNSVRDERKEVYEEEKGVHDEKLIVTSCQLPVPLVSRDPGSARGVGPNELETGNWLLETDNTNPTSPPAPAASSSKP